jgi:cytochrome c-type biogenesis protein CcmH/NrfG
LAVAYLLATALIRDKQVEKGQVWWTGLLRNGESAEAHLMLGTAKFGVADFAGARDEFAKAIALNPNLPEVHMLYAQTLSVTGSPEESMKEF